MHRATNHSTRLSAREYLIWPAAFCLHLLFAYALHNGAAAGEGSGDQELPRLTVRWKDTPLSSAADRLEQVGKVSIWIDRRVDPHAKITYQATEEELDVILDKAATRHGWRALRFGGVLYVGPRQTAEALPALAAALRPKTSRERGPWARRLPRTIPRGAQPRELLRDTLKDAGVGLVNPEAIPFDVWGEQDAGEATLAEFTVLVLAGFDLRAELATNGRSVQAVPIDYAKLRAQAPPSRVRRPRPRKPSGRPSTRVYSLKISEQPLKPVVEQLAQQTQTSVRWEPSIAAAGLPTDVRVSVDVREATFEELLSALLEQASLRHRLEAGVIVIELAE